MAGRANSVTDRVKVPVEPSRQTYPAYDLRVFLDGLRRLGYDADALLASAGLYRNDLLDPDGRLPCDVYGKIFGRAQTVRFIPNLALELAGITPIGAWPLLDYLVLTSDTVGAGLRQLAHYFRIVGDSIVITIRDDEDPIRVEIGGPAPFAVEFDAALIVRHLRAETDGRFAAESVSFRHVPDDRASYEQRLGCRVDVAAAWDGVSIPRDAWNLPLRRSDPVLRGLLESQADAILSRLPARDGLSLEVQRALSRRVAGGDTRIESVARELALSGRTLQRRLAEEGVSYQDLLDEARKEAASRYLADATLAIGEVAYLVGYSEPAPFHRAFRRWFDTTPEGFRQKLRQGK